MKWFLFLNISHSFGDNEVEEWMTHKLETRFLGEISIASDMKMISL